MNCKPNQLAMVVKGIPSSNLGKTITTRAATTLRSFAMWTFEGDLEGMLGGKAELISDDCLMPLDNLGPDAVDEVIQRIGTPHKEVA